MKNEVFVADIDLVRICQVLTLTHRAFNHCVQVQYCHKRKYDFNNIKQKDVAVYNNSGKCPSRTACIK